MPPCPRPLQAQAERFAFNERFLDMLTEGFTVPGPGLSRPTCAQSMHLQLVAFFRFGGVHSAPSHNLLSSKELF